MQYAECDKLIAPTRVRSTRKAVYRSTPADHKRVYTLLTDDSVSLFVEKARSTRLQYMSETIAHSSSEEIASIHRDAALLSQASPRRCGDEHGQLKRGQSMIVRRGFGNPGITDRVRAIRRYPYWSHPTVCTSFSTNSGRHTNKISVTSVLYTLERLCSRKAPCDVASLFS